MMTTKLKKEEIFDVVFVILNKDRDNIGFLTSIGNLNLVKFFSAKGEVEQLETEIKTIKR